MVENFCRVLGVMLVLVAAGSAIDGLVGRRVALASFEEGVEGSGSLTEDSRGGDSPIAVLEIDSLDVVVPVFAGTSRTALRRGAGSIEGTTSPGRQGNIGIAGHRDGYFRPLENIRQGDVIELTSRDRLQRFRVSEIRIVDALDVSVLEDVAGPRLTLVTCFPFRYVGFAPDRFVVHAALEEEVRRDEADGSDDAGPVRGAADQTNQESSLGCGV